MKKVSTKDNLNKSKKQNTIKNKKQNKQDQKKKEINETKAFLNKLKNKEKKLSKNLSNFSEFYDLPLRYNETIVRLLSQTPKKLFVYWDISDKDKKELEKKYTKKVWENSYPILIVKNKDNNETFEVNVNDFANSWYIDIKDKASKYEITLARKFKKDNQIINISNSNDFISSDEHINFSNSKYLHFRNVKNNQDIFIENTKEQREKTAKIYNIDLEIFEEMLKNNEKLSINNMSSSKFM